MSLVGRMVRDVSDGGELTEQVVDRNEEMTAKRVINEIAWKGCGER